MNRTKLLATALGLVLGIGPARPAAADEAAGDRRGYTLLKRYRANAVNDATRILNESDEAGRQAVLQSAFSYAAFRNDVGGLGALITHQRMAAFPPLERAYMDSVGACASASVARLQVMAETLSPLYVKELRIKAQAVVRGALTAAQAKGRRFVRECEQVNDLVQGMPPENVLKIDLSTWYEASRKAELRLTDDALVIRRRSALINEARVDAGFMPLNDGWVPGAAR